MDDFDGSDCDRAIPVSCVDEEYQWISERYPDAICTTQDLVASEHGLIDVLKIVFPNGKTQNIYFDITGTLLRYLTDKSSSEVAQINAKKEGSVKKISEVLNGALSILLMVSIALCYFWGVGWSFYRFGTGQGIAALAIPPYGLYRGVASIWDTPVWKENYEVKTEQIAIYISNAMNNSKADKIQLVQDKSNLMSWLKTVPQDVHAKLHDASSNLGLAYISCTKYLATTYVNKQIDMHPCSHPETQMLTNSFSKIDGFNKVWLEFVKDSEADSKNITVEKNFEVNNASVERLQNWLDVISNQMNSTVNELFAK